MSHRSSFSITFLLLLILSAAPSIKSDTVLSSDGADDDLCSSAHHQIQTTSSSSSSASCNIRCFRADPVCGSNGVTYWCGCPEAACEGVPVVNRGYCEVGNGGSSGQALLLVHIVWMIVLGVSVLFGFF